jgi:surfeit locus 1 family protein
VYAFLGRPKWIAFTLGVLALVVVMVNLGLWQLRRLDERQERNATVRERATQAAVPIEQADGGEWQRVQATGSYDVRGQVLVRNRSLHGSPGYHVLTPLVLASGDGLVVNRGFIPLETSGDGPAVPEPPSGSVTVDGRVRESQTRGRFGPRDPAEGTLTAMARADIARLQLQTSYPLLPFYVEVESSTPDDPGGPTPIPLPDLDDGPHLSYAIQWFTFAALAVVGWVVIVRKSARDHQQSARDHQHVVGVEIDAP